MLAPTHGLVEFTSMETVLIWEAVDLLIEKTRAGTDAVKLRELEIVRKKLRRLDGANFGEGKKE